MITTNPWATKYRPRKFAAVVGQERAVSELKGMIKSREIPNALLLSGPYGSGKTTLARLFARYINCETNDACGKCKSCLADPHPDVTELDAAEARGIDDVRALIAKARMRPIYAIRIFVLDELHRLTGPALSALLKSLEEPGPTTCYILCTNEPQALPDTILSRCRQIPLGLPGREAIASRLQTIADRESLKVKSNVIDAVVEASGGHIRNAINILQGVSDRVKAGVKDSETLLQSIEGVASRTALQIATKLLLSLYKGKRKTAASALLDLQPSGEAAIPFINLCLRLNEYVTAMTIGNESSVWHTVDNKKLWSLASADGPSLDTLLAVHAKLVDLRNRLQMSGAAERSLLLTLP